MKLPMCVLLRQTVQYKYTSAFNNAVLKVAIVSKNHSSVILKGKLEYYLLTN